MSDSIKKDDEKFNDLITKQHPTSESLPSTNDNIEDDDAKLEILACLQDMTQGPPEHASLEEKYEELLQYVMNNDVENTENCLLHHLRYIAKDWDKITQKYAEYFEK